MAERDITVFGAGAVGGYLGALLALSSGAPDVTLIGRPRLVRAVEEHGLIVRERETRRVAHPRVVSERAGLPPADLVLLTVRTFDVAASLPALPALMGERGLLLTAQNGVGTDEEVGAAIPPERMIALTLTVSVTMEAPGVVLRLSRKGGVALAPYGDRPIPAWVAELFRATGLPVLLLPDACSLRWSKLLLNMVGAATSSILDLDLGQIMADPALFRLEQLSIREAGRVMDRQGICTVDLPGYPVRALRALMRLPRPLAQSILAPRIVRARSGRSPSARTDAARGRTEIGAMHGAVARTGERVGVPAPVNAALAELTMRLAADPREREAFRGRPAALIDSIRARGIRL